MKSAKSLKVGACVALAAAGMNMTAEAAVAREARLRIAIPAQSLGDALVEFSRQTKQQLLFSPEIVRGRAARAISGDYAPSEALRQMLAGTGLVLSVTQSGTFIITATSGPVPSAGNALASTSVAQVAASEPVEAEAATAAAEIIVTARRREESLQSVPQTVNAVTGDDLKKFNIQRFEDIQSIVPGLDLSSGARGFSNTASMRGVSFATETAATPTVEFYLNDAPVSSGYLFQSLFDIGQIEVLRGPQGTLRGRAAPSGAITLTTRRPNLDEVGGYANFTGTTLGGINAHAAINAPLIPGVLALRVAGIVDQNDIDGVVSVNNGAQPNQETHGIRATLSFAPTDNLSARVMYQHLKKDSISFPHVMGAGSPGGTFRNSGYALPITLPAGYNGPVLEAGDRRGITDNGFRSNDTYDIVTAQLNWSLFGQSLIYVGSYATSDGTSIRPGDGGNLVLGYDYNVTTLNDSTYWTHELRLESEERIAGLFDYVLGVFHSDTEGTSFSDRGPTFGRGAFGSPRGAPTPYVPAIERYNSSTNLIRDRDLKETSFFGNITAYLGDRTEFSAGGRQIIAKTNATTQFTRRAGGINLVQAGGSGCAAGQTPSPFYPGFCDVAIATGPLGSPIVEKRKETPFIYNLQLSHRFNDQIMVYANHGTSWRDGPAVIGITNGGIGSDGGPGDPLLRDLTQAEPEKSKSYEIGFKATLFDRRARLNVALYRQTFDGLIYRGLPTYYLSDNGVSAPSVARFNFTSNADAKVKGIDIDASFQFSSRWSLSGGFSYAKGRIDNDLIPCNDGNFDGQPDTIVPTVAAFQAAGVRVAECVSNRAVSQSPKWSLSLQSEYSFPVSQAAEGYLRGLFTYYPENAQDNETVIIDDYGLLNVFAGLRDPDGAWEISLFAKNLTNTQQIISQESIQVASDGGIGNYFGTSGYYGVRYTPRRQFGLNVIYSFGSR